MEPKRRTEDLLKQELEELHRRTVADRKRNSNANEIEQRIDDVEMRWTETLEKERGHRLDQAQKDALHMVEQQELQSARRDRALQDKAMIALSEESKDRPIFHAARTSEDLNPALAAQRESEAAQRAEPLREQVEERLDRLRSGLEQSTDAIREGRAPDLLFLELPEKNRSEETHDLEKAMEAIRARQRGEEERER